MVISRKPEIILERVEKDFKKKDSTLLTIFEIIAILKRGFFIELNDYLSGIFV